MSEVPPLLLGETINKRFTIQNLFCASKRRVTHYPRVTKKKNKHDQRLQPLTKTNKVLLRALKDIHLWCPFEALALNFSGWLAPLVIYVFYLHLYLFYFDEAFASGWFSSLALSQSLLLCLHIQFLWDMCESSVFFSSNLYGISAYIFNSRRISAQVLYSSFLTCIGFVPAYSILGEYMHKWTW